MYIITREGEEETYTSFTGSNLILPLAQFRGPEETQQHYQQQLKTYIVQKRRRREITMAACLPACLLTETPSETSGIKKH
jgi:hypothetical protein